MSTFTQEQVKWEVRAMLVEGTDEFCPLKEAERIALYHAEDQDFYTVMCAAEYAIAKARDTLKVMENLRYRPASLVDAPAL